LTRPMYLSLASLISGDICTAFYKNSLFASKIKGHERFFRRPVQLDQNSVW
jgi:hypothetical protein